MLSIFNGAINKLFIHTYQPILSIAIIAKHGKVIQHPTIVCSNSRFSIRTFPMLFHGLGIA